MRLLSTLTALMLFAATCAAHAAIAPASGQVDIPSGSGVLHAQLFRPEGSGPFPVVIELDGWGGLGAGPEQVAPRYRDWAEQLLKTGHAVLMPDSYGSREVGPQCHARERRVLARRERGADIMAARDGRLQQS